MQNNSPVIFVNKITTIVFFVFSVTGLLGIFDMLTTSKGITEGNIILACLFTIGANGLITQFLLSYNMKHSMKK